MSVGKVYITRLLSLAKQVEVTAPRFAHEHRSSNVALSELVLTSLLGMDYWKYFFASLCILSFSDWRYCIHPFSSSLIEFSSSME